MIEAMTGAIFFGTPFKGVPVAVGEALVGSMRSRLDIWPSSPLIELIKPNSAPLRDLKHQFLSNAISQSVSRNMDMFCFLETHPMELKKPAGILGVQIGFNVSPTSMIRSLSFG